MINDLVAESYQIAKDHGFWDEPYKTGVHKELHLTGDVLEANEIEDNPLAIPTKLWLAAGELVEAGNVHHKQGLKSQENLDAFIEEIADVFIRLFDLVGYVADRNNGHVDLEATILAKINKNKGRPHKHGKNY